MQPYTPYNFAAAVAGDGGPDTPMADFATPPSLASPYAQFGSSSAMLVDGTNVPAPNGEAYGTLDPLDASYGPMAPSAQFYPSRATFAPPSQQHQQRLASPRRDFSSPRQPGGGASFADNSPCTEADQRRMSSEGHHLETEMLQHSGLGGFDGVPMSPSLPQYVQAGVGGTVIPARSQSYTAGEASSATTFGAGQGSGGGRPTFGRAETFAGPMGGGAEYGMDPFARLRAGHISITPSAASPADSNNNGGGGSGLLKSRLASGLAPSRTTSSPTSVFPSSANFHHPPPSPSVPYPSYHVSNPVYDLYGSSYSASSPGGAPPPPPPQRRKSSYGASATAGSVSLHAAPSTVAPPMTTSLSTTSEAPRDSSPPHATPNPSAFSMNPTGPSDAFDPKALGLPMPPPRAQGGTTTSNSYQNIYSSSGFDLVGVLARVVNRKRQTIQIGAIDMSCSFVVVDAKKFDQPIVYASETFSRLTGYSNEEIVGRNCRFLQAPGDVEVKQGEKRHYTDGVAAYHLRSHLVTGEDTQVSLINYHKGGKPFINLVTVIPITWDANSTETDFFVGFQVDLIDQPAAILDKMQNGSYVIDYSVIMRTVNRNPSITSGGLADQANSIDMLEDAAQHAASHAASNAVVKAGAAQTAVQSARDQLRADSPDEVVDLVRSNPKGLAGLANETLKKQFNRLLVDECDDLIHVVSLKGALLYVSAAARKHLEYEPSELLGKPLASFCHPSDIVSVQRELKDAGVSANPNVSIVFRIRRKQSGYVWWTAQGRLHLEPGKGRKCVILSGRPSEIMRMSWRDLEGQGGMSESPADEFFAKICTDAIFLVATHSAEKILGVKSVVESIQGKSVGDLSPPGTDDADRVMIALLEAASGEPTKVQHRLRRGDGTFVEVVTRFFPARSEEKHQSEAAPALTTAGGRNVTVVAQISLLSSEDKRRQRKLRTPPPSASSVSGASVAATPGGSVSGGDNTVGAPSSSTNKSTSVVTAATTASASSAGVSITAPIVAASVPGDGNAGMTSFHAVPSMYKTMGQPGTESDNVFNELDVTRGTSWVYELHGLRLINKRLREEREALVDMRKKKAAAAKAPPPAAATKNASAQRACANCGRTSSAEWRSGPTGPKTLCNACGLRWSKARSQAAAKERKAKEQEDARQAAEAVASANAKVAAITRPSLGASGTGSSSEAQSRSGSRDSGESGDHSTNPTTVSPSPALPMYQISPMASYGTAGGSSQPPSLNGSPMPMYPMNGAYAVPQPMPMQRPPLMHQQSSMAYSFTGMYPPVAHPPPPTGAGPPLQ
ncbi:hypothetical protein JCM11251_002998 [Rhodosporidiobolus azoricus]